MKNIAEDTYRQHYNETSVIIIGAGPCGLVSLRYLIDKMNVLCIECKDQLGGQWVFDKQNEKNHPNLKKNAFYQQNGCLPSSLYENLICNIPKTFMGYKDFPVKKEYDEFMTSEQFLEYIQDYSKKFDIQKRIVFNTYVSSVRLTKNLTKEEKESVGFEVTKKFLIKVTSGNDYTKEIRFLQADKVLIANGHYSIPNYPKIPNIELFKGQTLHVHEFRQKSISSYKNKHLVIYGSNLSAQDIVYIFLRKLPIDLRPSKITVIGNKKNIDFLNLTTVYKPEIQSNLLQYISPYIKEFDSENSLVLESGERVENIEIFLFATGYQFGFPFLDFKVDKLIDIYEKKGKQYSLGPLYQRLICVREPDLLFLGLMQNVLSAQQGLERQIIVAAKYTTGELKVPSQEIMQKEFENDFQQAEKYYQDGKDYLKFSFVGINEIEEFKRMAKLCKIPSDDEYNQYVIDLLIPLYKNVILGDYPNLKESEVTSKLPSNYYPKSGYF